MAVLRDFVALGKNTITSLKPSDVTQLYSLEWPETRDALLADHREVIDRDPRRIRRWFRIVIAIFYGLTKRLAPHRRVIFLISQVAFFISTFQLVSAFNHPPVQTFGALVVSFVLMTGLLALELIEKIKMRDELTLARDLQASLIPVQIPKVEGFDLAAFNHIANTVGGDIYDFVPLPDGRLAVLFGDASGHGMAAGLVMAVAHASFRTQVDVDASPAAVVGGLNRILCRTGSSRSFFSCCYLLLSPDGSFEVTMAGHPPMLKIAQSGAVVDHVGTGSYPLGIKPLLQWGSARGSLASGEKLVLHSDGLTEARNADGQEFGDSRVEVLCGWRPGCSASCLVDDVVGQFRMFTTGALIDDDVSVAVIART